MEAKPKTCYKCNETGHISRECPQNTQNDNTGGGYSGGGYGGGYGGGGGSNTECTNAVRSATLRGLALRQLRAAMAEDREARVATPVVALVTCRVTAYRDLSATIATEGIYPRIAHNLNDGRATIAALKDTSRVTAPTRAQLPKMMKRGEMFFSFQRSIFLSLTILDRISRPSMFHSRIPV
ncbi:Zinc finger, CCHC-type [Rhizoctonia solani]|uniref:Zinc finger, CCHC-type n=1 Tax=Rhizoctonia solani TaxID=456999 RepID=A0A8H8NTM7_9AGAM|nr:Zinc finger, CCHC-type [Rhizoctonia solani]QRW18128.1 Zinc finger, CCHC-type [Rhizoctonia solani]